MRRDLQRHHRLPVAVVGGIGGRVAGGLHLPGRCAPASFDPDHPAASWASASIERTTGKKPALLPSLGGSLPNACFTDTLGMPTVWVPHSYASCSQHAPDEHVLAPLMREGLRMMTGLFWDMGETPPVGRTAV